VAFLISLPAFIFYARGYQYDFKASTPVFSATGGFYVSADAPNTEIYINDAFVENVRTFRNASYIQRLEPGMHTLHVQAPGLQTWVKKLMVYPGIVTEVEAFNLPSIPQIRLVGEYLTAGGVPVVFPGVASSSVLLASTTPYVLATSSATSSLRLNPEYTLLQTLFKAQASTTAYLDRLAAQPVTERFGFSTSSPLETREVLNATTTVKRDLISLEQRGEDVYAIIKTDNSRSIPHYYCSEQSLVDEIVKEESTLDSESLDTESFIPVTVEVRPGLVCRSEIKMDRKGNRIIDFDFYPNSTDLVLLQLENGLYVVEIDDRVWQNSQLLYPGNTFTKIVYRGAIYLEQDGIIFEVLTTTAIEN